MLAWQLERPEGSVSVCRKEGTVPACGELGRVVLGQEGPRHCGALCLPSAVADAREASEPWSVLVCHQQDTLLGVWTGRHQQHREAEE